MAISIIRGIGQVEPTSDRSDGVYRFSAARHLRRNAHERFAGLRVGCDSEYRQLTLFGAIAPKEAVGRRGAILYISLPHTFSRRVRIGNPI